MAQIIADSFVPELCNGADDDCDGDIDEDFPEKGQPCDDGLLGACALHFLPEPAHDLWWTQLDALAEGGEPRRFRSPVREPGGGTIEVEVSLTRFATRPRPLALAVARPTPGA